MPSLKSTKSGQAYWRSLDELADSPEFRQHLQTEFPHMAELLERSPSRRQFLKVMGASLALAGLTGCRWPKETIVPYTKNPTNRTPGIPVSYATTYARSGVGTGLLVTSIDGRPIKIEGNREHPFSLGATDAMMQAAILEMYDPDRSQFPHMGEKAVAWDAFLAAFDAVAEAAKSKQGEGLAILSEPNSSPTLDALRVQLKAALPKARWVEYEPLSRDNERAGTALAFGQPMRPVTDLSTADVIVSFDSDFLFLHPAGLRNTREFARRRGAADGTMNRLYVIENNLSLTGSNADHRFASKASEIAAIMAHLVGELAAKGVALPASASAVTAAAAKADPASKPKWLADLAGDLAASKGKSVVLVGPRQPAEAHALAAVLNAALGNAGKTVRYAAEPDAARPSHVDAIAALADDLDKGAIETLLILGGNPAHDAPADLGFGQRIAKAKTSIRLSLFNDETSRLCSWHVPAAHFLETWGDSRAWDGTISLQQPLIDPLYGGRSPIDLVARLLGDKTGSSYELVRNVFKGSPAAAGDFDTAWRKALHTGLVAGTAWPLSAPEPKGDWAGKLEAALKPAAKDAIEVVFAADQKIYDGRYANNGWLQELPDPITKMTWDNGALISPADGKRWGVKRNDRIQLTVGGKSLDIPVCVVPGHAPGSITLNLGWGRKHAGQVAKGAGFDCYALRGRAGFHVATGATVSVSGREYKLVTTQDHHGMASQVTDAEYQSRVPVLVREGTLAKFKKDSKFAAKIGHSLPLVQMFADAQYNGPSWGMAIDLSKCTGCSACVVACQSENNIPVVGKEEVAMGREMHWIRIDRYFKGEPDSPELKVVHQPVACQHCENAPCEQVCPVAATVHDDQGLNLMVYNRCIGTRYCSNNCPYKVRRFNWFYNHHGPKHPRNEAGWAQTKLTSIEKLGHNPDVTVRTRGVMEKCTFCIQRIERARIAARNEQVNPSVFKQGMGADQIADGTVMTACQQACPAEAITFGDLRLSDSAVSKGHKDDRAYALLEELNVRPRNKYLAKLRNPLHDNAAAEEHGHEGHGGEKPAAKDAAPAHG